MEKQLHQINFFGRMVQGMAYAEGQLWAKLQVHLKDKCGLTNEEAFTLIECAMLIEDKRIALSEIPTTL